MGCCSSSEQGATPASSTPAPSSGTASTPAPAAASATNKSSGAGNQATPDSSMSQQGTAPGSGQASYIPKEAKGAKAFLPQTAASDPNQDASKPAPVPTSQSSGPKAVRGWAPPSKEWDKDTKSKKDQTRIEVKEEWDENGNLVRTTIKKTVTPDWKWKTEKTIDIIPAAEAAKLKK